MFTNFFYLLREYNVPVSLQHVIEFYEGLEKGLAPDMNKLFTFTRLTFVKKVEHADAFERAFAYYFYGIEFPSEFSGRSDLSIMETKQFKEWLKHQIKRGDLPRNCQLSMPSEELIRKFWETLLEQTEEHHGGWHWIGTGGFSPYGHSGFSERGIRVYGKSKNRSAIKVIGERRYINYASSSNLRADNIRQAFEPLKHIVPEGPKTSLNIDETIYHTARNGGEIELIFEQELRDKINVALFLDNGGWSMDPYVDLVGLLFSKAKDRFKDLKTFYFHNCIYDKIFTDPERKNSYSTSKFLEADLETRVLIVGDATMAPEELLDKHGSIEYIPDVENSRRLYVNIDRNGAPGQVWLKLIRQRFKYSAWLNPIPKNYWDETHGSETIRIIRDIFHMEDLTLNGIKNTVEYLNAQKT